MSCRTPQAVTQQKIENGRLVAKNSVKEIEAETP
jgi:hypothetical protein